MDFRDLNYHRRNCDMWLSGKEYNKKQSKISFFLNFKFLIYRFLREQMWEVNGYAAGQPKTLFIDGDL